MSLIDDIEGAFKGVGAGYGQQLHGVATGNVGELEAGVAKSAQGELQGAKNVATDVTKVIPWGTIALVVGAGLLVSVVLGSVAKRFYLP